MLKIIDIHFPQTVAITVYKRNTTLPLSIPPHITSRTFGLSNNNNNNIWLLNWFNKVKMYMSVSMDSDCMTS